MYLEYNISIILLVVVKIIQGLQELMERTQYISRSIVKATHRDRTSAAQDKTQGKRKADRWKIDVGAGDESTRLSFVFFLPNLLIIIGCYSSILTLSIFVDQ